MSFRAFDRMDKYEIAEDLSFGSRPLQFGLLEGIARNP